MKFEGIEKHSKWYAALKPYVVFVFRHFYKNVEIVGSENVPLNVPVIFAINHQGALMDAMAVLTTLPVQAVFLARADIFRNKRIAAILKFLKIMPVYRQRDHVNIVDQNDQIFEKCADVLLKNRPVGIMPEGTHGNKRKLVTLKKGIARIMFRAAKISDYKADIKVIPVGIDYSHYINFQSNLLIIFGNVMNASDYYELYEKDVITAVNTFQGDLRDEMTKLIVNIANKEYYYMYESIREIFNSEMCAKLRIEKSSHFNRLQADQKIIAALDNEFASNPEHIKQLAEYVREYTRKVKRLQFRDWLFRQEKYSIIGMALQFVLWTALLPIHVFGLVNNYLPYKLPVHYTKQVKDKQFHSSFKFVIALSHLPF